MEKVLVNSVIVIVTLSVEIIITAVIFVSPAFPIRIQAISESLISRVICHSSFCPLFLLSCLIKPSFPVHRRVLFLIIREVFPK